MLSVGHVSLPPIYIQFKSRSHFSGLSNERQTVPVGFDISSHHALWIGIQDIAHFTRSSEANDIG